MKLASNISKIVTLDDYRPHRTSYVACIDCGKDWVAVSPFDTTHFECPKCAEMSGVVVDPSSADFINAFMRSAKKKADQHQRTMVILNAKRMINEGVFD